MAIGKRFLTRTARLSLTCVIVYAALVCLLSMLGSEFRQHDKDLRDSKRVSAADEGITVRIVNSSYGRDTSNQEEVDSSVVVMGARVVLVCQTDWRLDARYEVLWFFNQRPVFLYADHVSDPLKGTAFSADGIEVDVSPFASFFASAADVEARDAGSREQTWSPGAEAAAGWGRVFLRSDRRAGGRGGAWQGRPASGEREEVGQRDLRRGSRFCRRQCFYSCQQVSISCPLDSSCRSCFPLNSFSLSSSSVNCISSRFHKTLALAPVNLAAATTDGGLSL